MSKKYKFDYFNLLDTFLVFISCILPIIILVILWPAFTLNTVLQMIPYLCLILGGYCIVSFLVSQLRPDCVVIDDSSISITINQQTTTFLLSDITAITFFPGYLTTGYHRINPACMTLFNNEQELIKITHASVFMLIDLVKRTKVKWKLINAWHSLIISVSATIAVVFLAIIFNGL